ncbi:TlpA family protein disulfide reductase [Parapedobacter tibetensis]|uniref:TlpA family protein disulfide reductase n=1 Tax=Parapedobacter tibetensis TaxID=2972951 RepID=UPI00214DE4C8|nr:TlpA disulfide reductase family protein [Parapedobacter tibetensis]
MSSILWRVALIGLIIGLAQQMYAQLPENEVVKQAPAVIYGEISHYGDVDTVEVIFFERFVTSNYPEAFSFQVATVPGNAFQGNIKERTFEIKLPLFSGPAQVSLRTKAYGILKQFLIEPGDSVLLRINTVNSQMSMGFVGNAAEKFRIQHELAEAAVTDELGTTPVMFGGVTQTKFFSNSTHQSAHKVAQAKAKEGYGRVLQYLSTGNPSNEEVDYIEQYLREDIRETAQWRALERNKSEIPEQFYNLLQANVVGEFFSRRMRFLKNYLRIENVWVDSVYKQLLADSPLDLDGGDELQYSEPYINYLMERMMVIAIKEGKSMTEAVRKQLSGVIRDKVIARYVFQRYKVSPDGAGLVEKALGQVETPWIREELQGILENSSAGKAVTFELPDTEDRLVKMSDFKGKVALVDFWFTGCMPCKWLYQHTLKDLTQHFKDNDRFVKIAISVDKDRAKWLKSVEEGEYTSPSSVNLTTTGNNHELLDTFDVRSYPYLMLVDQEGRLFRSSGLGSLTTEELIQEIEDLIEK